MAKSTFLIIAVAFTALSQNKNLTMKLQAIWPLSMLRGAVLCTLIGMFMYAPMIRAQDGEDAPSPIALEVILEGSRRPVAMADAGDGTVYIAYQYGLVQTFYNWQEGEELLNIISDAPVLAIERGLLGFALDPDFANNGYFYVLYTAEYELKTIVSRFQRGDNPGETYDSQEILIELEQPFDDHNGGQMAFGPDGYLYIAFGDGGGPEDPNDLAQDLQNLYGTVIRIDVSSGEGYSIPTDNPFVLGANNERPEIWLYGFRNPWRFSFDRATGDLYIADVGNDEYEEINVFRSDEQPGGNYGWSEYEGPARRGDVVIANVRHAAYAYPHTEGCAVIGGYVYRGTAIPAVEGYYLYSDYCHRDIWALYEQDGEWVAEKILDTTYRIYSFGEDQNGEIYALVDDGTILKVVAAE